jgi:hemoglobin
MESLYDRVGAEGFEALVARFYAGVRTDPVLLRLYPADELDAAEERLRLFLIQYWGGPTTYSDTRGHPRLRMRHVPFHIGPQARDAWLQRMGEAVDAMDFDAEVRAQLFEYFVTAAHSMQNQLAD